MKRIGFIGLGLIGGSIAKALRKRSSDTELVAYSRTRSTLDQALQMGLIDRACTKNDPVFAACDVIFLCAPVSSNMEYLKALSSLISPECIVTDVGSVKQEMVDEAVRCGLSSQFIGGHPMAGSERTGLNNAEDYLLENAYYFLTPAPEVPASAVERLSALVKNIHAIPITVDARTHDYIVASVSHVPHLVAASLVHLVEDRDTKDELMKLVAAGGFRDITRIASSSPEMWESICMTNREPIADALTAYIQLLNSVRDRVRDGDGEAIREFFRSSRDYRNSISTARSGAVPNRYALYVDLYDEAGGIATITTLLAMNGLNIKNIGIVHNREFEEGVLQIEFYDQASKEEAERILLQRNYIIRKRS
jgi:prephenate dehydrogenase